MDTDSGEVSDTCMSNLAMDFPQIHQAAVGKPCQYGAYPALCPPAARPQRVRVERFDASTTPQRVCKLCFRLRFSMVVDCAAYGAVMPAADQPGKAGQFVGIAKMDLSAKGVDEDDDAVVAQISYGEGRYGGEAVFVPRFGHTNVLDAGCDEGFLITYVFDEVSTLASTASERVELPRMAADVTSFPGGGRERDGHLRRQDDELQARGVHSPKPACPVRLPRALGRRREAQDPAAFPRLTRPRDAQRALLLGDAPCNNLEGSSICYHLPTPRLARGARASRSDAAVRAQAPRDTALPRSEHGTFPAFGSTWAMERMRRGHCRTART